MALYAKIDLAKGISWTKFHKVLKISLCYEFACFSVIQALNSEAFHFLSVFIIPLGAMVSYVDL
jgi:hypothetical protein